jgi:hypothetical protein
MRKPGVQALELSAVEIRDIKRLRQKGTPWSKITALRHSNENCQRVRKAFIGQTGTDPKKYKSRLLSAPTEEKQEEQVDRVNEENEQTHEGKVAS